MQSERVKQLREQSVGTKPYISAERAELLTDFYQHSKAGIGVMMYAFRRMETQKSFMEQSSLENLRRIACIFSKCERNDEWIGNKAIRQRYDDF